MKFLVDTNEIAGKIGKLRTAPSPGVSVGDGGVKSESIGQTTPTDESVAVAVKPRRRSRQKQSYAGKFLVNDRSPHRVSANISRRLFDRIKKFLPVIAPGVTLTSYLNNIIENHLETHQDEINELMARNMENIFD